MQRGSKVLVPSDDLLKTTQSHRGSSSHGGPPSSGCFSSGDLLALAGQRYLHGASFLWEDIAATGLGETD